MDQIQQLAGLSEEETNSLYDAVALVTILIAGADGNIDKEEKEWATKLTKIRSFARPDKLREFYTNVGHNFADKVESLIGSLPTDTSLRTASITTELEKINPILAKLDQEYGHLIYDSLTSFAEHVAKASGGFLRFGAVSFEEKQLMNLPMLTPIEKPEEEDEDA